MRPKTKIPIPDPSGSEFDNFDRLTGIIVKVKPKGKAKAKAERKKRRKARAKSKG